MAAMLKEFVPGCLFTAKRVPVLTDLPQGFARGITVFGSGRTASRGVD
jgi:hypothetical protein